MRITIRVEDTILGQVICAQKQVDEREMLRSYLDSGDLFKMILNDLRHDIDIAKKALQEEYLRTIKQ